MTSGFRVTLTAWLPCGDDLDSLIAAREAIDWLKAHAVEHGCEEIAVTTEFKQFRRRAKELDLTPSPPAPPQIPAEPPQPLDHAPAGPAAAGASEEGGDAPSPQQIPSTQSGQDCRTRASNDAPAAGNGGGGCSHQRMKTYGSGQVVCLDCQGVIGGEAE